MIIDLRLLRLPCSIFVGHVIMASYTLVCFRSNHIRHSVQYQWKRLLTCPRLWEDRAMSVSIFPLSGIYAKSQERSLLLSGFIQPASWSDRRPSTTEVKLSYAKGNASHLRGSCVGRVLTLAASRCMLWIFLRDVEV